MTCHLNKSIVLCAPLQALANWQWRRLRTIGLAALVSTGCGGMRFQYDSATRWPSEHFDGSCDVARANERQTHTTLESFDAACAVQRHHYIVVESDGGSRRVDYNLAFLEFGKQGNLLEPRQKDALLRTVLGRDSLKDVDGRVNGRKSLVEKRFLVLFVHGWRNNATSDTRDPERFQTALAYLGSFIDQRCRDTCRHSITGAYISWPGAVWNEKYERKVAAATPSRRVLGSFNEVFEVSNAIGPSVVATIQGVLQDIRRQDAIDGVRTRVLVMGHSAGANLLMAGLAGRGYRAGIGAVAHGSILDSALSAHRSGKYVPPLLGDLVVLFAPASPASRWIALQRRQLLNDTRDQLEPCGVNGCRFTTYPSGQRPVLMALSSACRANVETSSGAADVACDLPVSRGFLLSQVIRNPIRWLRRDVREQESMAIGYYERAAKLADGSTAYFGTSHVVTDNSRGPLRGSPTAIASLRSSSSSKCDVAWPWLEASRLVTGPLWDTGVSVDKLRVALLSRTRSVVRVDSLVPEAVRPLSSGGVNGDGVRLQWIFSHSGVTGGDLPATRAITDSNAPFWNVIAHSSVMRNHGGFYSYPLLCSLTQLWLDPVVRN